MASLDIRDEIDDSLTEGELPAQGGGQITPTVLPGFHLLQLPGNLDQCWEAKDYEKKDDDGNVMVYQPGTKNAQGEDLAGKPIIEQHFLLKFDKDSPLIVVGGGTFDGLPVMATITTLPRKRGKKTDANRPNVADMTYFVRDCLNDNSPVKFRKDWIAIVNKYAGKVIRIESGLSAQCDPERVKYVDDGTGKTIEDPDGQKGCGQAQGPKSKQGSRLYTSDFKIKLYQVKATGEAWHTREDAVQAAAAIGLGVDQIAVIDSFTDRGTCKNCGAALRGFFRIERFCKPLASV